jgi:DNA-binding XRE family transcriptional regulator
MNQPHLPSYLRSHRLKSGMSQLELAELIGIIQHHQVSNHERSSAVPSLFAALSYQAVFSAPVTELFPGIYETIRLNVEEQLAELEARLQNTALKGRPAQAVAQKLEWIHKRRNPQTTDTIQ